VLSYNKDIKQLSRNLRSNMTDSEMLLWSKIRGKQLKGLQFYRQKIIGNYIADFYCPKARLVIEMEQDMIRKSLLTSPIRGQAFVKGGIISLSRKSPTVGCQRGNQGPLLAHIHKDYLFYVNQ